jgi:carbon monoxide dehydrogenase subunit G
VKVTGQAVVRVPAQQLWAALHDPAVLARAIPGCERFEVTGPRTGELTVTTPLAAISGSYAGRVSVADQRPPDLLILSLNGGGERGTIRADLTVRLAPAEAGSTLVSYDASGVIDGVVAGVGARLLASAGQRLATDFLAAIGDLAMAPPSEPGPATTVSATIVSAGPVSAGPVPPNPVPVGPLPATATAADPISATSAAVGPVPATPVLARPLPATSAAAGSVSAGSVAAAPGLAGPAPAPGAPEIPAASLTPIAQPSPSATPAVRPPSVAVPQARPRRLDRRVQSPGRADVRAALLAGALIGLAGLVLGLILGRRIRPGRRGAS